LAPSTGESSTSSIDEVFSRLAEEEESLLEGPLAFDLGDSPLEGPPAFELDDSLLR
jgi:hypothetical protein